MSTELQERITRNVRILMAVQAINDQKSLAARLKWGADKLTRSLRGERRWAVADLQELADVFGVLPGDMLADAQTLVTASVPSRTGTDRTVSTVVNGCYPGDNSHVVIPFPQAGGSRRGYRRNWRRTEKVRRTRTRVPHAPANEPHSFAAVNG